MLMRQLIGRNRSYINYLQLHVGDVPDWLESEILDRAHTRFFNVLVIGEQDELTEEHVAIAD